MPKYSQKELRERRRIHELEDSLNYGGTYVGERQLYSGRPYYEYTNFGITKSPEQFKEEAMTVFKVLGKTIGLKPEIVEDYKNGIVDIAYLDSNLNGHIIHLEDDEKFSEAAKILFDEVGAIPILGFKWDGQTSPVFMAKREYPAVIDEDEYGIPVIMSGSSCAGISTCAAYRYVSLGVYHWIDGKLYDDYFEFESHDGIPYPVVAFPDLPDKDGNTADKVVILSNDMLN